MCSLPAPLPGHATVVGVGVGTSGVQGDGREEGIRLEEKAAGRPVRGPVEPLAVLAGGTEGNADGVQRKATKKRARDSIVSSKKNTIDINN